MQQTPTLNSPRHIPLPNQINSLSTAPSTHHHAIHFPYARATTTTFPGRVCTRGLPIEYAWRARAYKYAETRAYTV